MYVMNEHVYMHQTLTSKLKLVQEQYKVF